MVNSSIRSDNMAWVDASEKEKWPHICGLLTETMDMTVVNSSFFMDGKYIISGRTKVNISGVHLVVGR